VNFFNARNRLILNAKAIARSSFIPLTYNQSPHVGDVRLQSCEKTNILFTGDLFLADVNTAYGDYSSRSFHSSEYSHGQKRYEYIVNTIGKTSILKGLYRDRQVAAPSGPQAAGLPTYTYTANIYVWYEINVK